MENLGFADSPKATRIFVNKEGECFWYMWDSNNDRKIPIEGEGINCLVLGLSFREAKSDFGDSFKLDIHVQADKLYDLCAGIDTWFAKVIVATLDSATDEQLHGVLHIAPHSGKDSKKAVFCKIYDSNRQMIMNKHKWKAADGRSIPFDMEAAIDRINFRLNSCDRGSTGTSEAGAYAKKVENDFQEEPADKEIIPF